MVKSQAYLLSKTAEADVSSKYDYTFTAHGAKPAESHLSELADTISLLATQPHIGKNDLKFVWDYILIPIKSILYFIVP